MTAPVFEAPVVAPVPELDDGGSDDDVVHWSCCEDVEIAVCGVDLRGHEDVSLDPEQTVDCAPCLALGGPDDGVPHCPPNYCPVSALRSLKGPKKP